MEHGILDLGVMRSSPTLGLELTLKKKMNASISLFPTNVVTWMCTYLCTGILLAALFVMVKHGNSLSAHELWFSHTHEHDVDSKKHGNGSIGIE